MLRMQRVRTTEADAVYGNKRRCVRSGILDDKAKEVENSLRVAHSSPDRPGWVSVGRSVGRRTTTTMMIT